MLEILFTSGGAKAVRPEGEVGICRCEAVSSGKIVSDECLDSLALTERMNPVTLRTV